MIQIVAGLAVLCGALWTIVGVGWVIIRVFIRRESHVDEFGNVVHPKPTFPDCFIIGALAIGFSYMIVSLCQAVGTKLLPR